MGFIPAFIVAIIMCFVVFRLNSFLKPIESVYAEKKRDLRIMNAVCRLSGCVLLFGATNYALGGGCSVIMNSEGSSAAAVVYIFLLVLFVSAGALLFVSIRIRGELDSHANDYMLPDESHQLKNMKINEDLLYDEGLDENLSKANQYCRKTIEIATGFANSYTPGLVDCVNKNNYCACDILVFASQIIHDRMIKSMLDEAEKIADLYYSKMEQEVVFLCGANITQLYNYLSSRKFLRKTRKHTVETLARILAYDSVDIGPGNLYGWESPRNSDLDLSLDFDQKVLNHIIETADSLYDTIEKGFDEVLLK